MRNLYDMRILHVSLFGYLVLKKAGINESFVVGSDTVQVFFVAFPLGFNRWYHPLESKKVCFDIKTFSTVQEREKICCIFIR